MATRRYAALLRGVSPMNAKMPALARCFEAAGFTGVKTLLSSGNVVFGATGASGASAEHKLEGTIEQAMVGTLDRTFLTIVRSIDALRAILDDDPYAAFRLAPGAKRVVTFLRDSPRARLALPLAFDGARILCVRGREVFSAYIPGTRGPVFMTLIEKTFGQAITTRTWDTVKKVAADPGAAPDARPRRASKPRRARSR